FPGWQLDAAPVGGDPPVPFPVSRFPFPHPVSYRAGAPGKGAGSQGGGPSGAAGWGCGGEGKGGEETGAGEAGRSRRRHPPTCWREVGGWRGNEKEPERSSPKLPGPTPSSSRGGRGLEAQPGSRTFRRPLRPPGPPASPPGTQVRIPATFPARRRNFSPPPVRCAPAEKEPVLPAGPCPLRPPARPLGIAAAGPDMSDRKESQPKGRGKKKERGSGKNPAPEKGQAAESRGPAVPPRLKEMKNQESVAGAKLVLRCETSSEYSFLKFKWFKNGSELNKKNKPQNIKIQKKPGKSELRISKASLADSGEYMCKVISKLGNDSTFANITIVESNETSTHSVSTERANMTTEPPNKISVSTEGTNTSSCLPNATDQFWGLHFP
uniref:Neuregulin 1 n=1 Tax=Ornithorhynchus anatinus TaxID=9258 RepID=A0A6I8N1C8_ORNAN